MIKKQEINFKSRYAPCLNFALTLKEWFYCAECTSEAGVISFYPKISTFMSEKSKKLMFTQHLVWRIKYSKFKRLYCCGIASVVWHSMPQSKRGMESPPWRFSRLVWTKPWLTWPCIGSSPVASQELDEPLPAVSSNNMMSVIQRNMPERCQLLLTLALPRKEQQWLEGPQGWEWDMQCFKYLSVFFLIVSLWIRLSVLLNQRGKCLPLGNA